MALDKQKILNELGHVVNQLQSADCGCMGKLFSNPNQPNQNGGGFQNAPMMSPVHDGYMRGCCHGHGCGYGYNAPGAGEPFSGNRNCMGGYCNPPKLYADTYSYLNNNLMQPVVKEVYNDLKSISPANTMMNNPMGAQMGLAPGNPNVPGPIGGQMGNMAPNQMSGGPMGNLNAIPNQHHHQGPNVRFGNSNLNSQQMGQMGQPTPMSGMGPNIVNMMTSNSAAQRANNPIQQGGMIGTNAPQSPGMEQYNGGMPGNNPGQYNNMGMNNMRHVNPGVPMHNSNPQHMTQPNMYAGGNPNVQGSAMNGQMGQMPPGSQQMQGMPPGSQQMQGMPPGSQQMQGMPPGSQQMQGMPPGSQQMQGMRPAQPQMNAQNPGYGQHAAGMAKFNEMFPGVMQGGDLGFDPMAIAIQMNPANQQKAAMDTMQKMMMSNGKGLNANAPLLQPVINATNAAMANIAQPPTIQAPGQQNVNQPAANVNAVPVQNNQVPQQQVYTAVTGAPTINQQQVPQQQIPTQQQQYQGQYQQQQQMINPNSGAVAGTLPTVYEGSENPNAMQGGTPQTGSAPPGTQQMIKEPIFPADTSRNMLPAHFNKFKQQSYNTLGQPIDMMPADIYRTPEPKLPQTLSPQGGYPKSDPGRYSNVKATVSKTSLMGNRPVGRTPSRGQLQQIYNQYKGSQSFTQQNIKPPDNGASYSDGHLNVTQSNAIPQAPIERIGGDTATNNAINNQAYPAEQKPGHGDVPAANKPLGDGANAEKAPVQNSRVRNGLQDMKYTAYATTAAWSFHGATPAPQPRPYRFQYKV